MVGLGETLAVVGSAKKLIDFVKDAKELSDKASQQEIQKLMLQVQEEALQMQAENIALKQELFELKTQIKTDTNLKIDKGVYWEVDEKDQKIKGPYCQKCKDVENKLVVLQDYDDSWMCFNCKNTYWTGAGGTKGLLLSDYNPIG